MTNYRIAVIGGDGVGPEVIAAGMDVLNAVAEIIRALRAQPDS